MFQNTAAPAQLELGSEEGRGEEGRGEKGGQKGDVTLSFPVSKVRSHQRVLNRRMTGYDLGFKRTALAAVQRMDWWERQQR